jgi:hypothetical protein
MMVVMRPLRGGLPISIRLFPLALIALAGPARAGEDGGDYIRFVPLGDDGGRLETAVVTFERPDGVRVSLVAAVHVADRSYYQALNRSFEKFDALLYEMVKPEGVIPRPGERSGNIISVLQHGMKDILGLEFQLDVIDYTRPNFVHADMDSATFEKLQAERGENLFTLMLRAITEDLKRQAKGEVTEEINGFELLAAFLSRDRSRALKLLLGREFKDIENHLSGLEGDQGTVILTERNKVVIEVLRRNLTAGKKDIGIFYGGGHMPFLEKTLIQDLGFKRKETKWLVAWDMTPPGQKPAPATDEKSRRVRRL